MAIAPERKIVRTGEIPVPKASISVLRVFLLASVCSLLFIFVLGVAAFLTRNSHDSVVVVDTPAAVEPPVEAAPSTAAGFATLSDDAVGRGLLGLNEPMGDCFERALRIDPATPSSLRVGLTLRVQDERVVVLEVRGLSAAPGALRRCLEQVLAPSRSAGTGQVGVRDVTVRYRRGRVEIVPL